MPAKLPEKTRGPSGPGQSSLPRLALLLTLVMSLLLPACARFKEWKYLPATRQDERQVHLVNHGWHTGLVLARQDLEGFEFLDRYLGASPYYEFGWGEAEFYQAERNTVGLALRALFWRHPTVMHVVAVTAPPEVYFRGGEVVELPLSRTGLAHLRQGLRESFSLDGQGRPYPLKKGLYGDSRFFRGEGYYFIGNTCNRWTASLLERAGVPMESALTLRAASVIKQAEAARKRYVCCAP